MKLPDIAIPACNSSPYSAKATLLGATSLTSLKQNKYSINKKYVNF